MDVRLITHEQHQGNVDKGLPAGKAVGIVESMPYKVQHIGGKAGVKQQQKAAVHCLFPESDLPASQIEEEEHQHGHAAIYIGPVVQPDLRPHVPDMAGNHVKDGEVGGNRLGEIKVPGSRCLQRIDLRQQHHCGQPSCQQGIHRKAQAGLHKRPQSPRRVDDHLGNDIDDHKNTYHNRYIVIGKNGEPQGNAV